MADLSEITRILESEKAQLAEKHGINVALGAWVDSNRERSIAERHRTEAEDLIGFMLGDLRERLELSSVPDVSKGAALTLMLAGMLSLPRGMVILIDIDKLFDAAAMDDLQGMAGGGG